MNQYRLLGDSLSTPTPAHPVNRRFRLPVEPPTSELLIASFASIAGAFQLFAWALADLPTFFLFLGGVLIAVGLGFGLAALIRHYRLRWITFVSPQSLTVVNGKRRKEFAWPTVGAVRYANFRIQISAVDGSHLVALPVDRTRPAHEAAQTLERAIADHLGVRA